MIEAERWKNHERFTVAALVDVKTHVGKSSTPGSSRLRVVVAVTERTGASDRWLACPPRVSTTVELQTRYRGEVVTGELAPVSARQGRAVTGCGVDASNTADSSDRRSRLGVRIVGIGDKARNKKDEMTGKTKRKAGEATDNEQAQAEGAAQEKEGQAKQAAEKAKDILKD